MSLVQNLLKLQSTYQARFRHEIRSAISLQVNRALNYPHQTRYDPVLQRLYLPLNAELLSASHSQLQEVVRELNQEAGRPVLEVATGVSEGPGVWLQVIVEDSK